MEKLISCVQICVLFTCINLVVPYNTLHRSYDLNPTTDTFIDDNISENYSKDYLQLYWRSAFDQSRILMRFDIDKFKKLSKWGLLDSTSLSNTTLLSAKLRLTCIAGSLDNVVHASRIVRSWSAEAVTSTTRGEKGELWSMTFVETRGEDATSAIESKTLTVDAKLTAENVVFEIDMKEIFEHWLENTASNHGLLLWLQNTTSSGANDIVKFASTEYALVSFHPVINVVLEDEVFIKGNCTRNGFQCGDGSCIPNDKLCNFINDCLHATDETTCGIDCGFETPCGWVSSTSEGTIGWKIGSIEILNEDFYMYVNGSQEPSGTVSDLSHEFRDSNYRCQLHFNYFMSGRDVDSLEVDIAYNGVQYTVWTKAGGDYRDTWQGDVLNIGKLEGAFEVIFRAGTGGTKTDIIAIDNISLKDCGPDPENITQTCGTSQLTCGNHQCVSPSKVCDFQKDCLFGEDEDSSTCGIMPEGSRCNFEDGLCGWWDIVGEDNFNWTRHHGSTKSSGTGPSADHTLGTKSGFYIYTEASNQDPRAKAYIRSPWFPPPPPEVGDQYSEYYQMCQIRFYHHMFGEHNAELKLFVYHNDTRETVNQLFSEITSNTEVPWTLFKTPLQYTTVSYYLQFEVTRGFRYRGDIALDDISLSRECFTLDHLQQKTTVVPTSIVTVTDAVDRGTTSLHSTEAPTRIPIGQTVQATNSTQFKFSTCGAVGRLGPTQNDCDKAYQHSDVFVQLEDSGDEFIAGVQMWIVPVSRLYRITAKGASGGRGIESTQDSYGAVVMATFNLTKGDMLYILVGHKGESACDRAHKLISDHCKELDNVTRQRYGPDGPSAGGGGGGGGASYIAMFNKTSREWYPLLVAGGGGGLGLSDQKLQDGKNAGILDAGLGINGVMNYNASDTSGSGGGWNDSASHRTSGKSFFQRATGGQSCIAAYYDNRWTTSGGFGGGGGPCVSGGGGGGYTGGSASLIKDMKAYGFGGTSYTSSEAMLVYQEIGNHGDGAVQVSATVSCDLLENLSPDFLGCVSPTTPSPPAKSSSIKSAIIVAISIVVVLLLSFILLLIIYFYRRQSKKLKNIEEQIPAVQLAKLRENISVDVNPCYLLGDGTVSASDLKELPRNQIKLVRALGEGAFGEVFEGTYKVNSFESKQIAVKTLPEICTEQNEKDFLLEAMIMNNFNHPNIVKFIGVCFTQHPRFIILELMAGGELKQFLRDNRPVQNQPSKIKMLDLLHIAKDVAQGCCYLESKKFIHRDIAARNILLSTHSADRVAKIGDFGMARDIYGADYYRKSGRALLPVKWMPPEAFLDGIFTAKTDIWSFGVLLWEIMSLGYMPYPGMSNQEVIQFVSTGNRMSPPSKCPPQVYSLIESCWHEDPEERPSAPLLLERIGYCLQDPDVLSSPLPNTFPQLNRQLTVNRPADLENSPTLKVERSITSESQSPTEFQPNTLEENSNDILKASESNENVFSRQDSLRQYQFQFPQEENYQYTSANKMDAKQRQSLFCNRAYQYSASLGEEELNPLSQSFPRPYCRSVSTPEDNVSYPLLTHNFNIPNKKSRDDGDIGSAGLLGTNPFLPLVKKSSNPFTGPIKERTSLDESSGLLDYTNESTTSSNMSSMQGSSRSLENSNNENTDGSELSVDADGYVRLRERPRSRPGSRRGSAPRTNVRCSKTLSDVEIGAMCDPSRSEAFSGNIGTNPRLSRNVDGCATFPRSNSKSSESDDTFNNHHCSREKSLKRQKNNEGETGQPRDTSVKSYEPNTNEAMVSPGRLLKQDQHTGIFLFGDEANEAVV